MAVQLMWVLTIVLYVHGEPMRISRPYDTIDKCREAAIQAIERDGAKFSFCAEGYADPLQYLPYRR